LSERPDSEGGLRRELGVRDLTLFAIACIVGTRWIASAAHAGPGAVVLWVLAAVFFAVPLAIAVATLTTRHPRAGGMYLWARHDFGPWHGFLCFFLYWMSIVVWFPGAAMFYMAMATAALGPSRAFLAENRAYLVTASLLAIWAALGTNIVGVKIGKWTENAGALASWLLGCLLAFLAFLAMKHRGSATHLDFIPRASWGTLSFWATIAYAMSGMELVGLMGGEIRDPARTIPRAAWVASIFTVLFYAGTTLALLILLPADGISELSGLAQAGEEAGRVLGRTWFPPAIALLTLISALGQFGGLGASVSRMPFAAGVDRLLPASLARIHSRWKTPWVSMLWLGALSSILLILCQIGDSARAAYQTLISLMIIVGFLPYVYIFGSGWKAGKRVSACSGWGMTGLAILCSLAPAADIHNVWLFEAKLGVGTLGTIGCAWLLYRRRKPPILTAEASRSSI
jgi:amino acid transporter